jgi:homoserine dehydrogenase
MTKKVLIFGAGNIGTEAAAQLRREGYDVAGTVRRRRIEFPDMDPYELTDSDSAGEVVRAALNICGKPDVVVSAMPGSVAAFENELLIRFAGGGIPFVTAAKVALASNFSRLSPHLDRIGRNATVGGGTMMLDFMRQRLRLSNGLDADVHLVINGTMSYVMSNRWKNRPMEALLRECVALKYAEPSPSGEIPSALELFQGEIKDVVWKTLIVLNDIFFARTNTNASYDDFKIVPLDEQALQRYTASGVRRKYVVRITTKSMESEIERNAPGSIEAVIGRNKRVYVHGGFCEIPEGSAFSRWVPDVGPGNAVQIEQGGLVSMTSGDGAGPLATCMSIMHDVRTLCPLN